MLPTLEGDVVGAALDNGTDAAVGGGEEEEGAGITEAEAEDSPRGGEEEVGGGGEDERLSWSKISLEDGAIAELDNMESSDSISCVERASEDGGGETGGEMDGAGSVNVASSGNAPVFVGLAATELKEASEA